ncbi:MAG: hypothetical protein IPJ77_03180 [Planctomycetes bacterium]|nr:hypothetical protein [Planctomycetota bacterium]
MPVPSFERSGAVPPALAVLLTAGLLVPGRAAGAVPVDPRTTGGPPAVGARAELSPALGAPVELSPAEQGGAAIGPELEDLDLLAATARIEGLRALAARGPAAARAALAGFAAAPSRARRARAWLVFEAGGAEELPAALALLADPDAEVRVELVRFLGRADLGAALLGERGAALARLAREDADPGVRARAVRAACELDRPETLAALEAAFDGLALAERVQAARELGSRARVRERILARFAAGFLDPAGPFEVEVAAALLAPLARALVDTPALAADARLRGVLRTAALHPDGRLRRAAREALDALFARLELFGEPERAERVLGALAEDGFEPRELAFARARFLLRHAAEFDGARSLARSLARDGTGDDVDARLARSRALVLEAQAAFAAADDEGARSAFAAAKRAVESVLEERRDLGPPRTGREHVAALELAGLVAVGELALLLAPEAQVDGSLAPRADRAPEIAAAARELHVTALELLRAGWRADADAATGFDALLGADLSPFALVLENPRAPAWPARRALALRERVSIALGAVAPAEFPGFAPQDGGADPLADPARLALLKDAQLARLDLLQREFNELSGRLLRAALEDPCGAEPALAERAALLYFERQDAIDSLRDAETPAGAAGEGRAALLRAARRVDERARPRARVARRRPAREGPCAARGDAQGSRPFGRGRALRVGLELAAEIEMALGTTWGDGGDPARAEAELLRAVERLEQLEELVKEKKLGPGLVRRLVNVRSSALVSLAVNANVKQKDPAKALRYFERAWALRQDEFMRVLRACYSARAGRADEARAILREVTPSPLAHYNMACTYALCGDTELALDFLRREFEENQLSPGAAAKQRAWAKTDPDLASLRGDARFEAIVGK